MNLYTNTIPFDVSHSMNEQHLVPIGSTFGLIGANPCMIMLRPPKNQHTEVISVNPDIFKLFFKEVDLSE